MGKEFILTDDIRVDPGRVLARLCGRPFGINLNYLRDHDANRPQARRLQEAVMEMKAGHLRYPGGEKSDWVLFDRARPKPIGTYETFAQGRTLLNLDDFAVLCGQAGAVPHVVAAFDSLERTGISEEDYLRNAVGMVRYANLERGYGIRYWEIGNENWHNETASPEEMARVVVRFSKAMKALDPQIKICASGVREDWWARFLPLAVEHLDCLVVSQYSCMDWGSFSYFARHEGIDLVPNAREAIRCLQKYTPDHAQRVKVIIAELNSKDYADLFDRPHWADDNNLGHSLVTFSIFCQMLELPQTAYGMLWNTRWMEQAEEHQRIWYGLDSLNRLLPSAMPIAILGQFLHEEMLYCQPPGGYLAFASKTTDGRRLFVFLVNKSEDRFLEASVLINGGGYRIGELWQYAGTGAQDPSPVLSRLEQPPGQYPLCCPPVSLTILIYERESQ